MGACTSKHNPLTPKPAGDGALGGATPGHVSKKGSSRGFDASKSGISNTSRISPSLIDRQEQIQDSYMLEKKKLGFTDYSSVSKARSKTSGKAYAVKTVSKLKRKMERCSREITILRMLDHPNIVKLHETFEDDRTVRLVIELCQGGELSDRILEERAFSEAHAAILVSQILSAVEYLHAQYVCHRDIKPDNFLFKDREPIAQSVLKLLDFDQSHIFKDNNKAVMHTKTGCYFYASPQVLAGKYDHICDVWSCGVITHLLLVGYPPFYGETEADVVRKIKKGTFAFAARHWSQVSDEAQHFVRMLMKVNPRERYTAKQALEHDWLKLGGSAVDAPNPLHADFDKNLKSFRSQHKLQQASVHLIAGQLTEQQIIDLQSVFHCLDKDEDGMLNVQELREGLSQAGLKELPSDYENLIEEVKCSMTGLIDYEQFCNRTLELKMHMQEQACWDAFTLCDEDDDGKLTMVEVRQLFNSSNVKQVVDAAAMSNLLTELDATEVHSGSIDNQTGMSFEELMAMIKSAQKGMIV